MAKHRMIEARHGGFDYSDSNEAERPTQLEGNGSTFHMKEQSESYNLRFPDRTYSNTYSPFIDGLEAEPLDSTLPSDDFYHLSGAFQRC